MKISYYASARECLTVYCIRSASKEFNFSRDAPYIHDVGDPSAMDTPTTGDLHLTSALAVKLPPFWPQNAKVWFAQAEAQFGLGRITASQTPYDTDHGRPSLDVSARGKASAFLATKRKKAQFGLGRITASQTKFYHTIASFNETVAREVEDLLEPQGDRPYEHLKQKLMHRFVPTEEERF
ncbi:hypothetical protein M513_09014 [Trichuris suis]|uniref:DUF7041 domain-containing protein n=1 Tax=Trichuris suis TaxID=68888 RepID=A0A085LYK8_9BILA|nr:hypothetical protein M513_09014 [Trichuris suis]